MSNKSSFPINCLVIPLVLWYGILLHQGPVEIIFLFKANIFEDLHIPHYAAPPAIPFLWLILKSAGSIQDKVSHKVHGLPVEGVPQI